MIVVTGAAGFIGSNLIIALNEQGRTDILAVDDLSDGKKMFNLADCEIFDYWDKDAFFSAITANATFANEIEVIFHQGACSSTTEWDGKFMMHNNYTYSKALLEYCTEREIPYIYASSASVYGSGQRFTESREYENPINVYAYSKFLFDQYVRRTKGNFTSQVAGIRYFNVYGPREQHKGNMASVAFHFHNQVKEQGRCQLFAGYDGYGNGEQRRDFVYIEDVVKLNLWLWQNPEVRDILNCGTGRSQTFNDVAQAVIKHYRSGEIEYIPFPDSLKNSYQSFTEADITALRKAGYDRPFRSIEEAIPLYLDWLDKRSAPL